MSRHKFMVLPIVLIAALLWVSPVAAQADVDFDTCLSQGGNCYASSDGSADGDGTNNSLMKVETEEELAALQEAFQNALADGSYDGGTLVVIITDDQGTRTTYYEYDEDGEPVDTRTAVGTPPEVGVPLPFNYLLLGGALVGVLLIGIGIALRRRASVPVV